MIYKPCLILKPEMVKIDKSARIDSFTKIEGGQGVTIGENVHIASFCHLNVGGGRLYFGNHSGCSSGVRICTAMPNLTFELISAAEEETHVIKSSVVIGEYVVIFAGAVILPNVVIGDRAVVAAGSVVTKDVPPDEIWGGNPAKFMRKRNIKYEYSDNQLFPEFVQYHR